MMTEKGQGKVTVVLPLLPPLAESIEATKTGDMVFIAKADGTAMSKEGFGNWFADACVAADVPGRAHGLRKAGATRAANRGASDAQLDAIFGWSGRGMAALYTKKANRTRLAQEAASFLIPEPKSNVYSRTPSSGAGNTAKKIRGFKYLEKWWWGKQDSNLRRHSQRIYSPPPLPLGTFPRLRP